MDDETALALGRALLAALAEKAEEEATTRTRAMRRERRRYSPTLRFRLLVAQQHRCALCLGPMGFYDSHVDHVVPLARGGEDVESNLQLVHGYCNLRKGRGPEPTPDQERMPWA
jgi:5-methylcytosine-specific restriction endonuclease McrA